MTKILKGKLERQWKRGSADIIEGTFRSLLSGVRVSFTVSEISLS